MSFAEHQTGVSGYVGEGSVSQIVVSHLGLAVACAKSFSIHLGVHVSISNENAGPAAVIEVEELHSPSQPIFYFAEVRRVSNVVESILAAIFIQGRSVIAKIRL